MIHFSTSGGDLGAAPWCGAATKRCVCVYVCHHSAAVIRPYSRPTILLLWDDVVHWLNYWLLNNGTCTIWLFLIISYQNENFLIFLTSYFRQLVLHTWENYEWKPWLAGCQQQYASMESNHWVQELECWLCKLTWLYDVTKYSILFSINVDCMPPPCCWLQIPCDFPYTGLSGYEPDPSYCYDTFAESLTNNVFLVAKTTYMFVFVSLFLAYLVRVLYWFIDTKTWKYGAKLSIPLITTREDNINCARHSSRLTTNDFCNCLCCFGVLVEIFRSIDLNAWSDIIPFPGE